MQIAFHKDLSGFLRCGSCKLVMNHVAEQGCLNPVSISKRDLANHLMGNKLAFLTCIITYMHGFHNLYMFIWSSCKSFVNLKLLLYSCLSAQGIGLTGHISSGCSQLHLFKKVWKA